MKDRIFRPRVPAPAPDPARSRPRPWGAPAPDYNQLRWRYGASPWLRTKENFDDLAVVEQVLGYETARHLLRTAQAAREATSDEQVEALWYRGPVPRLFQIQMPSVRATFVRLLGESVVRQWLGLPGSRIVARPTHPASSDPATAEASSSRRAAGSAVESSVTASASHETPPAGGSTTGDDISRDGNHRRPGTGTRVSELDSMAHSVVPGRPSLTEALAHQTVIEATPVAVQMQAGDAAHGEPAQARASPGVAPPASPFAGPLFPPHVVQMLEASLGAEVVAKHLRAYEASKAPAGVHAAAVEGISGTATQLPHLEPIQRAFGRHDVSHIQAHVGGPATDGARAMGAEAFATGDHVAFASSPSLHTAAHEAAHIVQQRAGVQLKGGVGEAGDPYERHADAVADKVARGESAEALLDQHAGGGSTTVVQRRSGSDELDRRVGTHGGNVDGSGKWGAEAEDRGVTDRANHYMWTRVALIAETMGLTNAARHMRHYLGNTGEPLTVNVDLMLRDVELFRKAYDRQFTDARQKAELRIAGMGSNFTNFQLTGDRKSDVYCSQSQSRDWFFAIGGFTYWYTAEVQVVPVIGGPPTITMVFTMHILDRYNWDQGKSVSLAGMTVKDEQLGRLHRVGLAREYDVNGTSTPTTHTWSYTGVSTAPPLGTAPAAGDGAGGRADPSRERGRHFDNVRGSGG